MSKYTSGEIAKLCGVSVRTVQYYDNRGILTPSELSEGGRRLYTADDLKRLKIICFLRDVDVSINNISALLNEKHPERVILLLLEQQKMLLQEEMQQSQEKLDRIDGIKNELQSLENFSIESIVDIAHAMEDKKKLKKLDTLMIITAVLINVIAGTAIVLWIMTLKWWLLALGILTFVLYETWALRFYSQRVGYICPACHKLFKPGAMESIAARHSPAVRKMSCTCCGHKGFCVKTYLRKEKKKD